MKISSVSAAQFLLLSPAVLFMCAIAGRALPYESANSARLVVLWYAGQSWTLWVLLLALPLTVFATGCLMLVHGSKTPREQAVEKIPAVFVFDRSEKSSAASATVTAGGILAIVALHMLAN